MNDNPDTPQRQERFRRGMLCMYQERLRYIRQEFMAAMQHGDAAGMREGTREMETLLRASLTLITEEDGLPRHPHLRLLPH